MDDVKNPIYKKNIKRGFLRKGSQGFSLCKESVIFPKKTVFGFRSKSKNTASQLKIEENKIQSSRVKSIFEQLSPNKQQAYKSVQSLKKRLASIDKHQESQKSFALSKRNSIYSANSRSQFSLYNMNGVDSILHSEADSRISGAESKFSEADYSLSGVRQRRGILKGLKDRLTNLELNIKNRTNK